MNVILDIDETFVQFVGLEDWDALPEVERSKYKVSERGSTGLFILRPHFDEFFTYLFANAKSVNLWTWSDKDYAEGVARLIASHNPEWKVENIWHDDDVDASIEMHGHNKDLNYIWYTQKKFQPCDTILVDDLPKNTQNPSNVKNGIQVFPFHPLGEKLDKSQRKSKKIRTGLYTDLSKDDVLLRVIKVLEEVKSNPAFCSEGDMPHPFESPAKVMGGRRRTIRRNRKLKRTARKYRR
jgi:hypothetical protein